MADHVQLVWAHPRTDSLTATIVADVRAECARASVAVDEVDLYREGYDPVLPIADEPDWEDLDKSYSPETMRRIERTRGSSLIVFVFPIWWYSVPAIMKGYIDRVWNHGAFYGEGRRAGFDAVLWIGLAGYSRERLDARGYVEMMANHLNVGVGEYCGARESRLEVLDNTLGEDVADMSAHVAGLRTRARTAVRSVLSGSA